MKVTEDFGTDPRIWIRPKCHGSRTLVPTLLLHIMPDLKFILRVTSLGTGNPLKANSPRFVCTCLPFLAYLRYII
jgi:hypothetical protein